MYQMPANCRVATVADEEAGLVPFDGDDGRYEFVWLIDNETNLPARFGSYVVDTYRSIYADILVTIVEPSDRATWLASGTGEGWLPCATE